METNMAARSKKPVIAAQLYTLREFLKTPADMARTLKRVKKIGYDAAQISGVGPIEPAELRRIMLDAGVEPIGNWLERWNVAAESVLADS